MLFILGLFLADAAAKQIHMGFYDGVTNDTIYSTLNLARDLSTARAMYAAISDDQRAKMKTLVYVLPVLFSKGKIRDDIDASIAQFHEANDIQDYLENGTIHGFNMGDELVWNCFPPKNVTAATNALRKRYPSEDVVIWYNEAAFIAPTTDHTAHEKRCQWAPGTIAKEYEIPKSLTWFSVDIYHMDGVVNGWVDKYVRSYYESWIYPNLTKTQKALLVPGSYGSNVNHFPNGTYICDKACYDRMCAKDAIDFYEWAKEDDRVAAIAPWNWFGCPACNGSRWTPPHTCCMDEIGTENMAAARAAWEGIGKEILAGSAISTKSVETITGSISSSCNNGERLFAAVGPTGEFETIEYV